MALPFSISIKEELSEYMAIVGHFITVCKDVKSDIDTITTEELHDNFFDTSVDIKNKRNKLNATTSGISYYNNKLDNAGWVGNIQTEVNFVDNAWSSLASWYTTNEDFILNSRSISGLLIVSPTINSNTSVKNSLIIILDAFIALE